MREQDKAAKQGGGKPRVRTRHRSAAFRLQRAPNYRKHCIWAVQYLVRTFLQPKGCAPRLMEISSPLWGLRKWALAYPALPFCVVVAVLLQGCAKTSRPISDLPGGNPPVFNPGRARNANFAQLNYGIE